MSPALNIRRSTPFPALLPSLPPAPTFRGPNLLLRGYPGPMEIYLRGQAQKIKVKK